jgi:hypothetical protein
LTQPTKITQKSAASLKPKAINSPNQKPVSSPTPLLILSPPSPIRLDLSPTQPPKIFSQPAFRCYNDWLVADGFNQLANFNFSPNPSQ